MELVRAILFAVEKLPAGKGTQTLTVDYDGLTNATFAEHLDLLIDVGYIDGEITILHDDDVAFYIEKLTWDGHDFLDAARNDAVWKKAMTKVKEAGGSITMDLMKALLTKILTQKLGL